MRSNQQLSGEWLSRGCGALLIAIFLSTSVAAQQAEVISGDGIVTRQGQKITVGRGSKLVEGDRLTIPYQIQFLGDFGSFVASQRQGMIDFTLLRRESGCSRTFISYLGKLRITPRPLTCSRSIIQVVSIASGGSYTFRGTDAFLSDEGKRSTILVTRGLVETQSAGVTVSVPAGFANQITEGLPPEPPMAIEAPNLNQVQFEKLPWGVRLAVKTSPLNKVVVQGADAGIKNHLIEYPYPILGNCLKIVVENPLGLQRVYVFPLPTRK
jgi:hypothetical protein